MAGEIKIHLRQVSDSASEAAIGQHRVVIDRPAAKGGHNAGPMGGELFLAAAGGCFISNLLAAIASRDAAVTDVRLEVTGIIDDSPARFVRLDLRVQADTTDPETLEKLIGIADRGCIMLNTLRGMVEVGLTAAAGSFG